jgi:hypothetical protein
MHLLQDFRLYLERDASLFWLAVLKIIKDLKNYILVRCWLSVIKKFANEYKRLQTKVSIL